MVQYQAFETFYNYITIRIIIQLSLIFVDRLIPKSLLQIFKVNIFP
jgi:hypothetical protein